MPDPLPDVDDAVRAIVGHHEPLPPESARPAAHYARTTSDHFKTHDLLTDAAGLVPGLSGEDRDAHLTRLRSMVMVNLIETFERYLKEAAAACIDVLRRHVLDDRFDRFSVPASALAAHFGDGSLGRALCESLVWTDTAKVNDRFRDLLADPFEAGRFALFPAGRKDPGRRRFDTLEVVWQLRHTVVHNVGVVTKSDATKFRVRAGGAVAAGVLLTPTADDVRDVKRLLDDTVESADARVAARLGEVLTAVYLANSGALDPRAAADEVARTFGQPVTVAGAAGSPPP